MLLLILVLIVLIVYLVCKYISQRPKHFPPGPPNYPLLGGSLALPQADIHLKQEEWLRQYGGLVGVMMGPMPALFVQGYPYVQDALKKAEFQGRPKTSDVKEITFDKFLGIFQSDGPQWQNSRRFTVKYTKGFGVKNVEDILIREMDELFLNIQSGKVYAINEIFREPIVNVIWTILSGNRCSVKDTRIKDLLDHVTASFRSGRPGSLTESIINMIPFLSSYNSNRQILRNAIKLLQNFFRETIEEHRATLDPLNIRDFYDGYLVEQMKAQKTGEDVEFWTEEDLIVISQDVFAASYESINSSIAFLVLYLLLNPDVQDKMHQELDAKIGTRRPTLEDRPHLPYVQAVINEVFRINTIAPIVAPHRCTEDTKFHGYFIPKDTILFISLWSVLHEEKNWDEPQSFKPERFLNSEGQFDKSNPNMINFGIGKRACAGDFLAQNAMFLYITTFFHKYSVHRDPKHGELSTKAVSGFTTSPLSFTAIIRERF